MNYIPTVSILTINDKIYVENKKCSCQFEIFIQVQ